MGRATGTATHTFFCITAHKHLLAKTRFAGFAKAPTKFKDMKKILLSMLLAMLIPLGAVAQEAYAVLSGSILTLYYDNLRSTRVGTKYVMSVNSKLSQPWYNTKRNDITKVVIDPSFSNVYPEYINWFHYHTNLKEIEGFEYINTDQVKSMSGVFQGCNSLTSIDVSSFCTDNISDMSNMFNGCSSLTSLDVSVFNTNNVTTMQGMFMGCTKLTELDVSRFNTSNVTDMSHMFRECKKITELDLSNFDTRKVTTMQSMFAHCDLLTKIDVSHFDTRKVESMSAMFFYCGSMENLDLSNFDTRKVVYMDNMFAMCSTLLSVDLSGFNTNNVTSMDWMFHTCSSLSILDLSSFNTSKVYSMDRVFPNCTNLKTIYCSEGWTTENLRTDVYNPCIFYGCINLVGGAGTTYNASVYPAEGMIYVNADLPYAHIDGGTSNPGYLTYKSSNQKLSLYNEDNSNLITDHDGETADVKIADVSFIKNKWITLCLPFNVTAAQAAETLGDDVDIEELSSSMYNDETKLLTLTFTPCNSIVAGRPYVVKVSETKTTPIFYGVTIDKTDPTTIHTDYCSMTGIYNATPLTAGDKSTLFIQNNKFYYPSTAGSLPATKCYFTLTNGAEQARGIGMQFWDEDDAVTAIHDANMTSADSDAWYTSQGIRVSSPAGKGLFIHGGKKVFVGNWK